MSPFSGCTRRRRRTGARLNCTTKYQALRLQVTKFMLSASFRSGLLYGLHVTQSKLRPPFFARTGPVLHTGHWTGAFSDQDDNDQHMKGSACGATFQTISLSNISSEYKAAQKFNIVATLLNHIITDILGFLVVSYLLVGPSFSSSN